MADALFTLRFTTDFLDADEAMQAYERHERRGRATPLRG